MKLLNTTIGIVLIITTMLMIGCEATDHATLDKQDPLQRLLDGNARFVSGDLWHPHQTAARVKETASGQHPFAVVITCSDSRVSPEIMFDEGIGDLFTIRTAGNLLSDIELGSVEYAVEHLGAKLIAVVGHTECGAIKAFVEGGEAPAISPTWWRRSPMKRKNKPS
ncbi:MAG: carbonic anhydrase [Saprospiraceae bacterium]|nr:carbonic anhydrase [Saprospiraceae bacterium]